jgi:hypothetical protein
MNQNLVFKKNLHDVSRYLMQIYQHLRQFTSICADVKLFQLADPNLVINPFCWHEKKKQFLIEFVEYGVQSWL